MLECLECGAPASIEGTCEFTGIDYDGKDAIFTAIRVVCAAGHRYHEIDEENVVKL